MTAGLGALEARGLRAVRDGRAVLDGVSLTARPGEAVAVVGPSGSGKSTLLALLAGLERPDAGEVVRPAGTIATVLQAYGLVGLLTAAENVEVALQARSGHGGRLDRAGVRGAAAAALDGVGLAAQRDQLAEELSGGQQQRVAIARAIALEPALLLADEFTAELDGANAGRMTDLVLTVAARGGIVVLATHDPALAARCDRVLRLG